jgi:hypothetical protein
VVPAKVMLVLPQLSKSRTPLLLLKGVAGSSHLT